MAKLAVRNLTKTFGANAVLREISFEVADGEFCVLLGPSGCGKTTLLRLVAGLEEASGGMISLDGQRIDDLPPQKRDRTWPFPCACGGCLKTELDRGSARRPASWRSRGNWSRSHRS
ncbi:MAG: ABC transporter ATP-binding protein [Deltaproteobacteria bacterium]|nr:ABC transporter ATP-binding protein [Deltaproteobacteria bacterium]